MGVLDKQEQVGPGELRAGSGGSERRRCLLTPLKSQQSTHTHSTLWHEHRTQLTLHTHRYMILHICVYSDTHTRCTHFNAHTQMPCYTGFCLIVFSYVTQPALRKTLRIKQIKLLQRLSPSLTVFVLIMTKALPVILRVDSAADCFLINIFSALFEQNKGFTVRPRNSDFLFFIGQLCKDFK